ncbi:uncharacterized protein [Spinacia oleracea]|uniref:Uncharacterized protein isoform X2 n=1 Tax=Spinacia oleracea TaxID=3562 RepID=A0A9R0IAU7_SPIOL|nr:uncharacterized protein LOC110785609 isoform X2 [Spinacia oleracea]
MATDTTVLSYWLNWRFLLCAIYILGVMVFGCFVIWKYEGKKKLDNERRERGIIPVGVLYKDEVWKTCLKSIHPSFLLAFRILAFVLMLGIIIGNTIHDGPGIFFFYTQWTFTLTTTYFGLASALSLYGCWHAGGGVDAEQGSYVAPKLEGRMGYLLQIMYQVTAGAVLLTDVVFWLVIYPFLTSKYYRLAFFDVSMHSVNILILGDTILNCMRFPVFRISYFILWTGVFVICQWIIHACVSLSWPYPFMDLSPPTAPLWYAAVGVMHIPCFGAFALIVKLKHLWLSRSFSESYQGLR